jgi:peptide/nickel transport system permease protein
MAKVLHRLIAAVFVIFGALTLVFLLLHWLPGDPALLVAGDDASEQTIRALRAQLGSDQPLGTQYLHYLKGLAAGDLGVSFATGEPVLSRLLAQVPATLALTGAAAGVSILFGILLGVLSATHRGDWIDEAIQAGVLALTSTPSFCFGMLLILIFSVSLAWLPAIGNGSVAQLVLPVACLGLGASGRLARMVRNNVLDVLEEPFVTALRGKGLREGAVLYRHVLRNALIPVITMLGLLTAELLGGAVVIETLFARQGLGRLIQESVGAKDIPMVQGAVLLASALYLAINLIVDLSYTWIDRRIDV